MNKLNAMTGQLKKALSRFEEALALEKTDIVRDAAIQRFEFSLDLCWKTLKTFLESQKGVICSSPKDCFRQAFLQKLIGYEDAYLKIVDLRNQTAHIYDEKMAETIYNELPEALRLMKDLSAAFEQA